MSKADIRSEQGRIRVSGELTFTTVTALLARSQELLAQSGDNLEVDLKEVERVDSAGLALLIEWMREARARDKDIRFFHLPEQLMAIAAASDLDSILPVSP